MIVVRLKGDVIEAFKEGKYDAIVHGNNCFCNWGAGLVGGNWKEIKKVINSVTPDVEIAVYYL